MAGAYISVPDLTVWKIHYLNKLQKSVYFIFQSMCLEYLKKLRHEENIIS